MHLKQMLRGINFKTRIDIIPICKAGFIKSPDNFEKVVLLCESHFTFDGISNALLTGPRIRNCKRCARFSSRSRNPRKLYIDPFEKYLQFRNDTDTGEIIFSLLLPLLNLFHDRIFASPLVGVSIL